MDLTYNYGKILKIAKEVRKNHSITQTVEMVQFVFTDENVLHLFVKEGLDIDTTDKAIKAISEAMENGEDYLDIQKSVVRGLIDANFYKKELRQVLDNLEATPNIQE